MRRGRPERRGVLTGMDLETHLADPGIRQRFVTRMFDAIAPRYDRFTRVFSLGMDDGWKRELLAEIPGLVPVDGAILDLACGTGDLALGAARAAPGARVTGIDASPRMIALARERLTGTGPGSSRAAGVPAIGDRVTAADRGERGAQAARDMRSRIEFLVGDMMRLPVPDASIDVVTVGYGLRNVPAPARAVTEIARVLRPGGYVLVLDFYRPESRVWRAVFLAYLRAAGNLVGWLWHREPVVYGYIAPSIAHYVTPSEFAGMLERAELAVEVERRKLLGGICLHRARKGTRRTK